MSSDASAVAPEQSPVSASPPLLDKQPSPHSDYVPPLQRKLGPLAAKVNPPVDSLATLNPVAFELRKIVALVVKATPHSPAFTGEFLDELTRRAETYMDSTIASLHHYTETQRHLRAGVTDLEMCLAAQSVTPGSLYAEYVRTQRLAPALRQHATRLHQQVQALLREYYADKYTLDKDDPSLVFHANEQYEIAALVPRHVQRREYIPPFFPDFPPDFTYQLTGDYMRTTTELKEIKMKLVEESALNEQSLYELIDDDDLRWNEDFESKLQRLDSDDSDADDIMSDAGKPATDVESPQPAFEKPGPGPDAAENAGATSAENKDAENKEETHTELASTNAAGTGVPHPPNPNRFDFVEFARKTRRAKERRKNEVERRRRLRENNIYMKAEKVYSCYAAAAPTPEEAQYFEDALATRFMKVVKATRSAEQRKKEKLAQLLAERTKREQEQNSGSFEFGFAFNPAASLLDDSDDNMEPEEFDFGADTDARNGAVANGNAANGEAAAAEDDMDNLESQLDDALAATGDADMFGGLGGDAESSEEELEDL